MLPISLLRLSLCWIALVTVGAAASAAASGEKTEILIYTTTMGAYSNPSSVKEPGFTTELAVELAGKIGATTRMANLPWRRALNEINSSSQPSLIFPLVRTKAREPHYQWLLKAIVDRSVFLGKRDAPPIRTITDVKRYRIGAIRGSPFERELKAMKISTLDIAADAHANAKKLAAGRIDYWFVTVNTGLYTIRGLGASTDDYAIGHTTGLVPIYIAGNLAFPSGLASKLQTAFAELKKSAWYAALVKKYMMIDASDITQPSERTRHQPLGNAKLPAVNVEVKRGLSLPPGACLGPTSINGKKIRCRSSLEDPVTKLISLTNRWGGGLTEKEAKEVVVLYLNELTDCYTDGRNSRRDLGGAVTVQWTIDADGGVSKVKADAVSAMTNDKNFLTCITRKVSHWRFWKPRGRSPMSVEGRFHFASDN